MEDKIYKITLADGFVIENLKLNGNNFISAEKISEDMFRNNCCPIVINDGTHDEIHECMELVQVVKYGDKYHFILRDLTRAELERIQMQSDIEYLAMMSGIEL